MATAADNQPEEVDGNGEILNTQNLDYSGLHYCVNNCGHNRGDGIWREGLIVGLHGKTICERFLNVTLFGKY
jgi:hypothetical protein